MRPVLAVIPARYASTRLPAKPLALIHGRPMVQWVYESAKKALKDVVVATDDRRIAEVVRGFGGDVVMTPVTCASGTDRMAAVARKMAASYYVNIQGDEPMMQAATVKAAIRIAQRHRAIGTAVTDLEPGDRENPNAVKCVLAKDGRAMYFSRSLIPYPREEAKGLKFYKHLGIYAYPREMLFKFVRWPATVLEQTEKLEQLRALYNGAPIYAAYSRHDSVGVDTPADLKAVTRRLSARR